MRTQDKTSTSYEVDGLDPGTAYVFKVVSISGTGELSTTSNPRVLTVTTGEFCEETQITKIQGCRINYIS